MFPVPNNPSHFSYSKLAEGVLATGTAPATASDRPAASRFVFVGEVQPDSINVPSQPSPPPPPCDLAGTWIQDAHQEPFNVTLFGNNQFNLTHSAAYSKRDGWTYATGTWDKAKGSLQFAYWRPDSSPGEHGWVKDSGVFVDCNHIKCKDSTWHRGGTTTTQVPSATFNLNLSPGETETIRVVLTVAGNASEAAAEERVVARDLPTFEQTWAEAASKWEHRWQQAFTPNNEFFSGNLPSVEITEPKAPGANVNRVFYMSALTVVTVLRTNLPLVAPHAFVNGQGNLGGYAFGDGARGIGGSRSWWWDEGLSSILLSLLEPAYRAQTLQAWLAHDKEGKDVFGHGLGNGYAMDCEPLGVSECTYSHHAKKKEPEAPEYGFYCYNPWAYYMAMSNHVRINNATDFLAQSAANTSATVDDALETIATDWQEYVIPGTKLVDYGPKMDGFSPTYKHVMPGCSQGNNIYMLRDLAALREGQGRAQDAAQLRSDALEMVKQTIEMMYTAEDGHGWFNVLFPPSSPGGTITAYEMRHLVDFFSMIFGMCGLSDQPCDMDDTMRRELSAWFKEESVTRTWTRATSPRCNCSNTWSANHTRPTKAPDDTEFPAYTTCAAGRPDHGSDGAYPSWPAFSVEALCYIDQNCSAAFQILSSFAENTFEGPFGQANQVPQLSTPPYTPFNDERAFKPVAGVNRYIGIEGGSFVDSIIRGFFGYHPSMFWTSNLTDTLHKPHQARGFTGTLSNLRTPLGLATITSNNNGLSIHLQK